MANFKETLQHYIDAALPIVYVDTMEDDKAAAIIKKIAKNNGRKTIEWSVRKFTAFGKEMDLNLALEMLMKDKEELEGNILIIKEVEFFFDKANNNGNYEKIISSLKYMAQEINAGNIEEFMIVIVAPLVNIPKELEIYCTILSPDPLDEKTIEKMLREFCEVNDEPYPDEELAKPLINLLKGLTATEIENIFSLILSDDGQLTMDDLKTVLNQKQQMIKKSGILQLEKVDEKMSMSDIGGLENLKEWLEIKRKIFHDYENASYYGVDMPKGVLIAGMPGCGKSLTAKTISLAFGMPLLRMDMGRLMGKYVGESEYNMRRALQLAEASAPCILWIDELEKAFAGIKGNGSKGNGSEVTTRLFGTFLTWMQEKKSAVFVVATANNIDDLPPELLRKGRFDEIFYVGFPNNSERQKIFELHIKKRRKWDATNIDYDKIVNATMGYCGADIEGVVKEAIEYAFIKGGSNLTTDDIMHIINNTHSISDTMKESIEKMDNAYKKAKLKPASRG